MLQVSGRILDAPRVKYASSKVVQPRFGGWNLQNVQFVNPASLESYGIACMAPYNQNTESAFLVSTHSIEQCNVCSLWPHLILYDQLAKKDLHLHSPIHAA